MNPRVKWRNAAAALAAGALATTLWASPAVAEPDYPSQDDIDQAHQAEHSTAEQISAIEVELAQNSAELQRAQIEAEQAAEAYNEAKVDLEQARSDADDAKAAAEDAEADLAEAQQKVAQIAMASYRDSGQLQHMSMFLSADDFDQALDRATLIHMVGTNADQAYQRMDAAERVAQVMRERAQDAVAEAEAAAADLEEASRRAEASSLAAQNAVETTSSRHDDLVAQLADLRNTTVEMEQERQEALEAERQERENAAAAEALGAQHHQAQESEEQSDSSDSRSEQTPSRSHTRSEPEQEATQESASSGEQGGSQGDSGGGSGGSSQSASDEGSSGSSSSDSSSSGSSSGGSNSGGSSNSGSSSSGSSGSGSSGGGGGSTAPSSVGQAALNWAMTQRGKPYVWGADGPDSYDCSGLTMRAFQHAGASLPRTTGAQYAATTHVPVDQMRPGDLIFYSSNGSASGIYHVAIYAGDGMRVHAPAPGQSVEYVPVWWTNVLPYAGRV